MAMPPSETGAVHETVACALPATVVTAVGATGAVATPAGIMGAEGAEMLLVPAALVAVTVNVYAVPLVRPCRMAAVPGAAMVAVAPGGLDVTV